MDVINRQEDDVPGTVDLTIHNALGEQEKSVSVATGPKHIRGTADKLILESTSESSLSFSIDKKA